LQEPADHGARGGDNVLPIGAWYCSDVSDAEVLPPCPATRRVDQCAHEHSCLLFVSLNPVRVWGLTPGDT
jgi:hypothetical protein